MEKILSVVIPTYNMENYLSQCIKSLIVDEDSLMNKLEILIVNDGSNDSSSEIAHLFEKKYSNVIRVIDKQNGNYGSCINVGLKESIGKYIKILDADDQFVNLHFKAFLEMLLDSDADMIISDYQQVNEKGRVLKTISFPIEPNKKHVLTFDMLNTTFATIDFQMHAVTYKRSIFQKMKYTQTEGISYTDQEWMFEPVCYINNVQYFNRPVYLYLLGREGQTMNPKIQIKKITDLEVGLNKMLDFYYGCTQELYDNYLKIRILQRLKGIYQTYFYIYSEECKAKIATLDNRLKDFPALYHYSGEICLNPHFRFKFVSVYRKGWHRTSVLIVRVYQFLINILKA